MVNNWISTTTQLPIINRLVLLRVQNKVVKGVLLHSNIPLINRDPSMQNGNFWHFCDADDLRVRNFEDVTHWQELEED
jgi:hypothetical protein